MRFKLAIVAGLAITLAVQMYAARKTNELNRNFMAYSIDMNIISEHFLNYIEHYGAGKDIRLYDMGEFLGSSYLELNRDYCERGQKNSYIQAAWTLPAAILNTGLKSGIYAVLIYAALQGGITAGSIAKYAACIMMLAQNLTGVAQTVQSALDNNHYLRRYFSYFDIPNKMYQGSLTVEKRDDNEYYVEFRNVSFRYPNTKAYALSNVSLKFRIGEKLAIVGMNGSGKTTFIKPVSYTHLRAHET